MEGAQPSRPVHRRPANSPKGIYKPIDPRPKLLDAGHHHKPDDPRPKEPDAGHHHTPREQSVGTNHGGLFIQIDHDGNQRIVYPRSSLPRDKDVRPAHERGFYVPGNLNNEPLLCSARPGSSYFSSILDGAKRPLISVWEQGKFYFNMMKTAKGYYDHYSIGPGLYKYIGSETKGLLYHDYLSKSLRMEENTKYFMWMAKFSFDGILGAQTKAVFYLPTPTFQSKIEFQSLHRFAALTRSFGTGNRPCLDFSCMLGTKLGAVGCNYKLDPATSEFNCSAGLSVKTPCTSVGLIMLQQGSEKERRLKIEPTSGMARLKQKDGELHKADKKSQYLQGTNQELCRVVRDLEASFLRRNTKGLEKKKITRLTEQGEVL